MKKVTALALALLMALTLCACGGSSSDAGKELQGTYTLYAMDYDENTTILASELFEGKSYVTLKSGGAAEVCMEDDVANVKWKADGANITITAADGDMTGSVKNGILTLVLDNSNLYFVAEGASTDSLKAITMDEMLNGVISDIISETPAPEQPAATEQPAAAEQPAATAQPAPTEPPKPAEPTEIQQTWNGWYFGCIDLYDCTGDYESLNGETFDITMYIELGADGSGRFTIFDPFGTLIENDENNLCANAWCHADENYLYADSGEVFGCDMNAYEWIFVHNAAIPEKVHVGSSSTNDAGETICYDFQFKPWGDRWEGDPYTQFIPYFNSYIGALDAGLSSPFGDTFPGFGIANYEISGVNGGNGTAQPTETPAPGGTGGGSSALLGASPEKLDVNDRGVVTIYYPGDQFVYDDWYGKLKNEETGVGILLDPMLGATNFEELKASYEKNNSDEKDYSLTETTINGYKALIMTYTDWLDSTMRVDIDFGGNHDGWYGISFSVSGDSLDDCDTELVWAIIESMELTA